jgi:hypothetical protein
MSKSKETTTTIKLTVPSYFTDYRTPEQRYNDIYLEKFLFLRLLKKMRFLYTMEIETEKQADVKKQREKFLEQITEIETLTKSSGLNILNIYDGLDSFWTSEKSDKDITKLDEKRIKYIEEVGNQKGGGEKELKYYNDSKNVNSIKNYGIYSKEIESLPGNYSSIKDLIQKELSNLIGQPDADQYILSLLMGRNIDISVCNDNIRYILAESKYRSIRDSAIIPENDKVIQCSKLKKILKDIIDENNKKCKTGEKITMPADNYWTNYHNDRKFYAVNHNCENFIVPVPYNKFQGDIVIMSIILNPIENVLENINEKCIKLEKKNIVVNKNFQEEVNLLFGGVTPTQIENIYKEMMESKFFNPHEFINYNSMNPPNNSNRPGKFLSYLKEYFSDEFNTNEDSFNYNLNSPVIFSYSINNTGVLDQDKFKEKFNCKDYTPGFNYDNYYFVNVPSYLKNGEYFQVNILTSNNNIKNVNQYFIKFNIESPSDKYGILLIEKTQLNVRQATATGTPITVSHYISPKKIQIADKSAEETITAAIEIVKLNIFSRYRLNSKSLQTFYNKYRETIKKNEPIINFYRNLITEIENISGDEIGSPNNEKLLKIAYSDIENKLKMTSNYKSKESEYISLINSIIPNSIDENNNDHRGDPQSQIDYDVNSDIEEVDARHKFSEKEKSQEYVYPKYPGLINFYMPLDTPNPINSPEEITIINETKDLTPPPPPYPRLNEEKMRKYVEEQTKYNLKDSDETKVKNILDPARIITKYIGEKNAEGKKHGQGIAYYKNGDIYKGIWKDNVKNGPGISTEIVNYVTGEIGSICKFYYKGYNILNNTTMYSTDKADPFINQPRTPNIVINRQNRYINDIINYINAKETLVHININKYMLTHNFQIEVEEE